MKIYHLFLFCTIFIGTTLSASPATQAAMLADDVYLSQQQFIAKYENPAYELIPAKALSIKYYLFSQKEQLVIVFEGTKDMSGLQTDLTINEVQFLSEKGSLVHNGYFSEALSARFFLSPYLNKNKKIIITGHSLGGAVAHLLAAILYREGYAVNLYTFGEPPVGNERFVESIKGLSHERYTHVFDLIPMLKKEYVVKMKAALSYLNRQLPENEMFYDLVASIDGISYAYVHQGEHHYIYNLGSLPAGYDESPWYKQMVTRVQLYHSSKNYFEGVQ
ncbi:MAG: hypothetical protein WBF77_02920 [Sulfurimonadaceae bacterium]